jgi:ComF family protein
VATFTESLRDFVSLIYPDVCICCGEGLGVGEEHICMLCLFGLPKTNFHLFNDNILKKMFSGRVPVDAACAMYYYRKGETLQTIVHEMKYKGRKEIGTALGRQYGYELAKVKDYANSDYIIPVPLHSKKLKKRGYNQSEFFAKGLSEILAIPVNLSLYRKIFTETQTHKTRYKRWENVNSVFEINNSDELRDKQVILVDDIITTGATIEGCANALLNAGVREINICAIGFAKM